MKICLFSSSFFWVVTQRILVVVYRRFETAYRTYRSAVFWANVDLDAQIQISCVFVVVESLLRFCMYFRTYSLY